MLAPLLTRSSTIVSCPLSAAAYSAVQPLSAAKFTSAEFATRSSQTSNLPWRAAQMIDVAPSINGIFSQRTAVFAAVLSAASSSASKSTLPFLAAITTSFVS